MWVLGGKAIFFSEVPLYVRQSWTLRIAFSSRKAMAHCFRRNDTHYTNTLQLMNNALLLIDKCSTINWRFCGVYLAHNIRLAQGHDTFAPPHLKWSNRRQTSLLQMIFKTLVKTGERARWVMTHAALLWENPATLQSPISRLG